MRHMRTRTCTPGLGIATALLVLPHTQSVQVSRLAVPGDELADLAGAGGLVPPEDERKAVAAICAAVTEGVMKKPSSVVNLTFTTPAVQLLINAGSVSGATTLADGACRASSLCAEVHPPGDRPSDPPLISPAGAAARSCPAAVRRRSRLSIERDARRDLLSAYRHPCPSPPRVLARMARVGLE
jgi:hypothetical protein